MAEDTNKPKKEVTFSAEQLEIVNGLIANALKSGANQRGADPISMYNLRDPLSIETVNVRQRKIDGKFVVAYKDQQQNPFDKAKGIPLFVTYKPTSPGSSKKEPYLTLILSSDGIEFEEAEVRLDDFMNNYPRFMNVPCLKVNLEEKILDHGLLGGTGEYARAIDDHGMPVARPTVQAQSKIQVRTFLVQLPGFNEPYLITNSQFLA